MACLQSQRQEADQDWGQLVAGPVFSHIMLIFVMKNTENSFSSPVNQVWVSHLQRKALHLTRGDPVAQAYSPLKPAVLKREAKDKYKWEDTYDSGILKLVSSTIDSLPSIPLFQSSGLIYLFCNRRTWHQGANGLSGNETQTFQISVFPHPRQEEANLDSFISISAILALQL